MIRSLLFMLVFASFALSGTVVGTAQEKKTEEKKTDPKKMETKKDEKKKEETKPGDIKPVEAEEQSFRSADGVKLAGKLYRTSKSGAPIVLMLHDYKADPNETVMEDTAQLMANRGLNVLRFDFRGHGKSTDIVPSEFWLRPENRNLINLGGKNPSTKDTIKYTEFKQNYYPMLVQDIAAARHTIDLLNDTGVVNSSTIYMVGVGDSAGLGMLYLASEWSRERIKPALLTVLQNVNPNRPLYPSAEAAGLDFGGAIWLSPTRNAAITSQNIKDWVLSPRTINMRIETPMLFINAEKDQKSSLFAKFLYKDALMVDAKSGPNGQRLTRPEQTFLREIKGSSVTGTKLLGSNLGTEKMIEDFLKAVNEERKSKTSKNRDWDKPLFIEVTLYGVCR